jgi:hypothetical protein
MVLHGMRAIMEDDCKYIDFLIYEESRTCLSYQRKPLLTCKHAESVLGMTFYIIGTYHG